MTTLALPPSGNTYRDDFNGYRPIWRALLDTAGRLVRPLTRPVRRYLRRRARGSPPLSERLRRDIGLAPHGEAPGERC